MRVNLDGAFFTAQAAGKIFKKQGSGNVIFTSSVSSKLVNVPQKQAPYNASKAAVSQLAKCLAVEWVDFARVNIISPGFIATDSESGVSFYNLVFLTLRSDCRCAKGLDGEVVRHGSCRQVLRNSRIERRKSMVNSADCPLVLISPGIRLPGKRCFQLHGQSPTHTLHILS